MELRLLPLEYDAPDAGEGFSHTVLSCWGASAGVAGVPELFTAILDMSLRGTATDVPPGFKSYVSIGPAGTFPPHYGVTAFTRFGRQVKCLTAAQLCTFADDPGVTNHHRNRAVWAYLAQLPPLTRIALFWH